MTDQPWMPFYITDFRIDTLELRTDEMGVYFVMICLAWARNGPLPGDDKTLKHMLGRCFSEFHGHTYNRIVPKLLERYFYRDIDGNWRQKRVEKELEKARKISEKQSQKGIKSAAKRSQTVSKRSANGEQTASNRVANAQQTDAEMNEIKDLISTLPQSQSHIEKEDTKKKENSNKGMRLPKDWVPSERSLEICMAMGYSRDFLLGEGLDGFRGYWCPLPGVKARKLDWDQTFQNRMRERTDRQRLTVVGKANGHDLASQIHLVFVKIDTPPWDAWCAYRKIRGEKSPPNANGGWHFPSEWPPDVAE
jgi:uncharacterized protein YdaU (DUF1376 family)